MTDGFNISFLLILLFTFYDLVNMAIRYILFGPSFGDFDIPIFIAGSLGGALLGLIIGIFSGWLAQVLSRSS